MSSPVVCSDDADAFSLGFQRDDRRLAHVGGDDGRDDVAFGHPDDGDAPTGRGKA